MGKIQCQPDPPLLDAACALLAPFWDHSQGSSQNLCAAWRLVHGQGHVWM